MPHAPDLPLPQRTLPVPPLRGPSDTLARAHAARPRPFLLTAPGASLRGVESRGIDGAECGGRLLLAGLEVRGAVCANVMLAPAQARRELLGRAAAWTEILLVTPDGVAAQWSASGPGGAAALDLTVVLPGESWHAADAGFVAAGADGVRVLQLTPAPEWSVREEPGRLVVRAIAPAAAAPVTLIATAAASAVDAGAQLARVTRGEPRAEGDALAYRTRRLATETGVDDLDDGLAWAAARLDAALDAAEAGLHDLAAGEPFPFDPDARRGWTILGALATDARAEPPRAPGGALELLALARAGLWRDRGVPDAVVRASSSAAPAGEDPAQGVVRRAALLALADAVEPWSGKPRAQELRAAAAAVPTQTPTTAARPGSRRLPTLGAGGAAPRASPIDALLAAALDLPGRARFVPPAADPPPGLLRALTAWACLNDGDLDRGFALFRAHLADGFAEGVGLWPDGSRIHDPAAAAAVPLVFLDGLLGARGDAHYGRLRLAPRLPPHWNRLAVRGIELRDARVRLDYEAADGAHRFRIVQESGAVPLMLVFEPILPVRADARVRIDGAAAAVNVTPVAGRAQLRVQLPLDAEREISIG